ncbi:hypothetical protein MUK42_18960 [Musa troglodytarum]|uniref:Gamma-butyrobetaine hydroxylase-like N-terminal domain-containing protein n=1 Tax=Musa troglodytarum TaxID=320322 RepID=A0A9E7FRM6_9LILI|nr:hypothetical protein MUK42_18960 [Musa troglodytarum]
MSSSLLLSAVRRAHASAQPPRLTRFALHPPKAVRVRPSYLGFIALYPRSTLCTLGIEVSSLMNGWVEVEFSDGSNFNLPAEFLRVYSPAVDSKIRTIGGEKVISGRRHVGIMSAEPVGNYGVREAAYEMHRFNSGIISSTRLD